MLLLFRRSSFRFLIGIDRAFPAAPRMLHGAAPGAMKPGVMETTVSYFVESYGLTKAAALKVVSKCKITTTDRAKVFLSLLRAHGFTQKQIAYIATSYPELLTYDQQKRIIPKFEFFASVGYSSSEIVKIISLVPYILCYSLENRITPNFHTLSGILGSDRKVVFATGKSPRILVVSIDRMLLPNIKTLRDIGVPQCTIMKFATVHPLGLINTHSNFNYAVSWLKKIGFDVSKPKFVEGLCSVARLTPFTLEKKLELYRSLGWSDETIFSAFRKYPRCMSYSEEKILKIMSFFHKEMKCDPSYISERPFLLYYSFEKRIAPRYKIFCLLRSNSLTELNMSFMTLLFLTKKEFTDRFVTKYVGQIPDLFNVYKDN